MSEVEPTDKANRRESYTPHDIMAKACMKRWGEPKMTWDEAIEEAIEEMMNSGRA